MNHYIQIERIIPLRRSCDGYEVEAKYDFISSMLEMIVDHASFLGRGTFENMLEWLEDALSDLCKHKDMLADEKQAELESLHRVVLSCTHIARYHYESYYNRSAIIRKSAEDGEKYWKEIARQTSAPTPRAQKLMEKLQYRYHW